MFLFFIYLWGWTRNKSTITAVIYWLVYHHWITDGHDCEAFSGMNEWQEKPMYWEKTCPNASLFTADPKLFDTGSNAEPSRWAAGD
jgi:hypothetical protein